MKKDEILWKSLIDGDERGFKNRVKSSPDVFPIYQNYFSTYGGTYTLSMFLLTPWVRHMVAILCGLFLNFPGPFLPNKERKNVD